ncbi:unnamed protein product [Penicillium manginii]
MSISASPKSRLLITHVLDFNSIFLFKAQVSRQSLGVLRDMKAAIYPITRPTIGRKKIPFRPYNTFPSGLKAEVVTFDE